ncbi:hypothetical protein [Falsiroseomonas sp.]|uniref:hypothetical protein n=1 Tax=Falsiroseomonas sp. TaxID=2870721 RepID=UPI003F7175C7
MLQQRPAHPRLHHQVLALGQVQRRVEAVGEAAMGKLRPGAAQPGMAAIGQHLRHRPPIHQQLHRDGRRRPPRIEGPAAHPGGPGEGQRAHRRLRREGRDGGRRGGGRRGLAPAEADAVVEQDLLGVLQLDVAVEIGLAAFLQADPRAEFLEAERQGQALPRRCGEGQHGLGPPMAQRLVVQHQPLPRLVEAEMQDAGAAPDIVDGGRGMAAGAGDAEAVALAHLDRLREGDLHPGRSGSWGAAAAIRSRPQLGRACPSALAPAA